MPERIAVDQRDAVIGRSRAAYSSLTRRAFMIAAAGAWHQNGLTRLGASIFLLAERRSLEWLCCLG
jgi:hypothetical protein